MGNKNFLHREYCFICGSNKLETKLSQPLNDPPMWAYLQGSFKNNITQQDVQGVNFNIVCCPKCELYFVPDVPTDKFYEKLTHFQTKTDPVIPTKQHSQNIRFFANYGLEAEKIAVILNRKPHDIDVLEFGSGNGHWLLMAKAYGYNTKGVEIREERIAYAKNNCLSIVRSLEELKEQRFDYIRSDQVFEHLSDPLMYFRALTKYLKPGGFMWIQVPKGDKINKVLSSYNGTPDKSITPIGHINCFTHQALINLAASAGMVPIPAKKLQKIYLKAMWKNRDTKYIGEILKVIYKRKTCALYLQKKSA